MYSCHSVSLKKTLRLQTNSNVILNFSRKILLCVIVQGFPLTKITENRQFSLQIIFSLCPFNSTIVRYFPSKCIHMYLCGIHHQRLWPNCCKDTSFGAIDAIRWDNACRGPNGSRAWPRSLLEGINSPWLVTREVVIPSCQIIAGWLQSSITPPWRRLTTENTICPTIGLSIHLPISTRVVSLALGQLPHYQRSNPEGYG